MFWAAGTVIAVALVYVLALALCAAAASGDRQGERAFDDLAGADQFDRWEGELDR